jgi:hypothetical protein
MTTPLDPAKARQLRDQAAKLKPRIGNAGDPRCPEMNSRRSALLTGLPPIAPVSAATAKPSGTADFS